MKDKPEGDVMLNKLLYTEKETSELTGIPQATLRTRRSRPSKDGIPYVKDGKSVRYPAVEIKRWIAMKTRR